MSRKVVVPLPTSEENNADPCWSQGMLRIDRRGPVAILLLDRPHKLNALDRSFWTDIRSALDWVVDQGIRAMIITGTGERAFSVGGDIASFAELTTADARKSFQIEAMAAFNAVSACPVPIIAAVNGLALGGGCELAMACDFVLAGRTAKFGLPEARFGLVPGYGVLAAPAIVGVQMAKMLVFTGEPLDADDALRCGLAQKLCEDEALIPEAFRLAQSIAATSEHAVAVGKALLGEPLHSGSVAQSVEAISALHATAQSRQAVAHFLALHRHRSKD